MALSPITKSRLPSTSDAPNGPQQMQAAIGDVEQFVVMRFDSSQDRNARMVGIVPKDGMVCYLVQEQIWQEYRSGWTNSTMYPEWQDGSILGVAWDGSARLIHRAGSRLTTTGANGAVNFAWGAFPHGLMSMSVKLGDYVPDSQNRANGTAANVLPILANMSARSSFNGIVLATNNAPLVSGVPVRINYDVWGW